ncbi:MAG TPA: ribosome small subunit-dependent GTPase A [Mycobacteriales bacterium]|nr:ribosome small subunit-dependent GTPase A [Mycobacteriales bacterium]
MSTALTSLGWDEHFAAAAEPYAHTHLVGRVTRAERGLVDCLTDSGPVRARQRLGAPVAVTGDWLVLIDDDAGWWVDGVLPRRTAIARASASGQSAAQVLAANVDIVLVTVPVFPEPRPAMVERLVALAWDSGATPMLVVTKTDLSSESSAIVADLAEAVPGVDVHAVSAETGFGITDLQTVVSVGRTACLLGRSGAGKSTLVNALSGVEVVATGDIRRDGKGRHTTTARELIPLPGGGVLLDTPGLRGAGLWVGDEGLERTFGDVEALVVSCRFNDCGHDTEPGCAVQAAVEDGRLPERRLASWRKLQREAQWIASRADARLRAEQRREWKLVHMEMRRSGRTRP